MENTNFNLKNIIKELEKNNLIKKLYINNENLSLSEIKVDSRKIEESDIFISYHGESIDSSIYIKDALEKKVSLIISDIDETSFKSLEKNNPKLSKINTILVSNSRLAWSILSSLYYNYPQNYLKIIGITGTNGKTSTVWFIKEILKQFNIPCLCIGTLGIYINDKRYPSVHTTPDPDTILKYMDIAYKQGIKYCIMEVSSHSLSQDRVSMLKYDLVAFTSFSQDHLDFHHSMQEYFDTKVQLFKNLLKDNCTCIICNKVIESCKNLKINTEDLFSSTKDKKLFIYGSNFYDVNGCVNYIIQDVISSINESKFILEKRSSNKNIENKKYNFKINLFGTHILENFILSFLSSFFILDKKLDKNSYDINISHVPGRLEKIDNSYVFVDYAHTPDGLEKTLDILKQVTPHSSKLICVFGCGGDRDRTKRKIMAEVSEKYSDTVYVTNDNPRTEDENQIISDIIQGFSNNFKAGHVHINPDRALSIKEAITHSNTNDIICIAGKGHEDYMIIGTEKIYFSDQDEVRKALK